MTETQIGFLVGLWITHLVLIFYTVLRTERNSDLIKRLDKVLLAALKDINRLDRKVDPYQRPDNE